MGIRHRLKNWRNPHNQTDIHLADLAERYGFDIGSFSYGRPKVRFPESGRKLTIGRYCSIADRVEILLGGNHRIDWGTTYPFSALPGLWPTAPETDDYHGSRGDVTIGNDVWLARARRFSRASRSATAPSSRPTPWSPRTCRPMPSSAATRRRSSATASTRRPSRRCSRPRWWDLPRDRIATLIPLLQSDRIKELVAAVRVLRAQSS